MFAVTSFLNGPLAVHKKSSQERGNSEKDKILKNVMKTLEMPLASKVEGNMKESVHEKFPF